MKRFYESAMNEGNNKKINANEGNTKKINAVVCDLDGTLLHTEKEAIPVKGRSGVSFMARETASLLAKISRIFPLVIATGRNAVSTRRLVMELPDVRFFGFVFENGFVAKKNILSSISYSTKWERMASLFPAWERLPFYENCLGLIPPGPPGESPEDFALEISRETSEDFSPGTPRETPEDFAGKIIRANGFDDHVYRENRKIFIYPGRIDKMRGLSMLGVHPYIAMGDEINDLQMLQDSSFPVTSRESIEILKAVVHEKNGFCSPLNSHEAACDMLEFAYRKIMDKSEDPRPCSPLHCVPFSGLFSPSEAFPSAPLYHGDLPESLWKNPFFFNNGQSLKKNFKGPGVSTSKEHPGMLWEKSFLMADKTCFMAVESLLDIRTRPFPERIAVMLEKGFVPFTRKRADTLFEICEKFLPKSSGSDASFRHASMYEKGSLWSPFYSLDFDQGCIKVPEHHARGILDHNIPNRSWIEKCLYSFSRAYGYPLSGDIINDARSLLDFLFTGISAWEADSFPMDCMLFLENRYGWTFSSKAWSLREQLRQEALVMEKAWNILLGTAEESPMLLMLNQMAPWDYFTANLPDGAALLSGGQGCLQKPVLIHDGIKISSSEYRTPLDGTREGSDFARAIDLALSLGRIPVLCDLSRRRFPRSFIRAADFARQRGMGVVPGGKVFDPGAVGIPRPKSPRGFPVISGDDEKELNQFGEDYGFAVVPGEDYGFPVVPGDDSLYLFDPWPVSDPEIIPGLSSEEKKRFSHPPFTKPWQDDRIGARFEKEMNERGSYETVSEPWIVPALGGWVRVDDIFRSRLGRFL
ncbi:MAG: hypothetical protein HQK66_03955 [Desulfamplus sp.]|nr:hypothetical protein [Desulfamplus sp.]